MSFSDRMGRDDIMAQMDDEILLSRLIIDQPVEGSARIMARDLLDRFGALAEVLSAPADQLMAVSGISQQVADHLSIVHQVTLKLTADRGKPKRAAMTKTQLIARFPSVLR